MLQRKTLDYQLGQRSMACVGNSPPATGPRLEKPKSLSGPDSIHPGPQTWYQQCIQRHSTARIRMRNSISLRRSESAQKPSIHNAEAER